jgi:NADPH-dependent curcumin reductase CurA
MHSQKGHNKTTMTQQSKQIILVSRPSGKPTKENFRVDTTPIPKVEAQGDIVAHNLLFSVDPYMRGRMSGSRDSYIDPFELNEVITGFTTAQVTESNNNRFKVGDIITGMLPFAEYFKLNEQQLDPKKGVTKVHEALSSGKLPLSYSVSVLGMPGETAHIGILHYGKIKSGETVLISAAAGAVGLMVGQIAKIKGCRVVGTAGSDDKVQLLKEKYGFDDAFNYKKVSYLDGISKACPNGIDVYFDNVGGDSRDAALLKLNRFGRIIICGAIAEYNEPGVSTGPRLTTLLLVKNARMEGFIVLFHQELFEQAVNDMAQWAIDGKLKLEETVHEGFDNIIPAFIGLFHGDNIGKMLVKVANPTKV